MPPTASLASTIERTDREIAEAEQLIHEGVQSIIVALRKGGDTIESEKDVAQMRAALELLHAQRRKLVRGMYDAQRSSATAA
ncbi:MAG: hypothetical protein JOZ84_03125 [Methylobacteriaceae bacterium]|nr:hypothetical protein [Methylobacteriaceae bacterium]